MPKLVQKLIRKEGRGENAPALPRRGAFFRRLASRGSLSAGGGVVAAAVVVVSLLTWLAPDSDRPVPLELVDRVLPGAAEQVEERAAALIEGGKEAAQSAARNVREGVVGAGLRAAQDAIPGGSLSAPFPAVLPTPSSTPSSPSSEEPSAPSEPSASARDSSLPATTSEPSVPKTEASPTEAPATEAPLTEAPPAPSEPATPLIAEGPPGELPPPAAEEPAPPAEEPPAPPAAEEPPITETQPPATGEPLSGAPG